MPIMLNTLLRSVEVDPADVRLMRHKDKRATKGRSPYELWRDDRDKFDLYQSSQKIENRSKFSAPYWCVFVVNLNDETMFAGLYRVEYRALWERDTPMPHIEGGIEKKGGCDGYNLVRDKKLAELIGRMFIDWGAAKIVWAQYAATNDKEITELRRSFTEEPFPGYLNFIRPLSKLDVLPLAWISALKSSQGIYLLTCPKTKEQYVGSATGENGFWGRLQNYLQSGHGGNKGLKSRDPSDYQVSILEVAGSAATVQDISEMEGRWQLKFQSTEMGLNRKLAGRIR